MSHAKGEVAAPERWFGQRAALADVQAHSIGGGLAILLTTIGYRAIRFVAMLVLARILTPADYGVFAVVMGFAGMAGLLYELGLATATVQRSDITPGQISTMFWINVGCAAVVTAIGVLGAPWLGRLYGDPRIETMCRLIAFSPLLGALGLQHLALLQRALEFRRTAIIGLLATTLGAIVTVLLAWLGSSFIALAIGLLATQAASSLLAWSSCGWRPGPPRLDPAVREMLAFGGYLVGFGILGTVASGLHSMLLGLAVGVDNTGIYYRAGSLMELVQGLVLGMLVTVATTALSHLKDRPEEFRHYYLRCIALLCSICAPAAALGWLFANDLVLLVFGSQWTASAPLFAIMCLGALFYAVSHSTGWIYVATGNAAGMMRWGLIGWPMVIAGTLIGVPLGLTGLAIAQTVTVIVVFVPCMTLAFRGTGLTWRALGESAWRPVAAALAAGALVAAAFAFLPVAAAPRLITGGALFALVYLLVLSEVLGQRPQLLQFSRELAGRVAQRAVPNA